MIGRQKEVAALERAVNSARSEFVAVYGRRRIGKTYLIRKTLGSRMLFSHSGVENVGMEGQSLGRRVVCELASGCRSILYQAGTQGAVAVSDIQAFDFSTSCI